MFQDKYVFAQLTAFLNRTQFNNYVRKYDGNRYVKHFTCWNQLLAMMFGQLSNRESLRDLIVALEAHRAKQYHLGLGRNTIVKATLAYANQTRDYRIFEDFAFYMMKEACKKRETNILNIPGKKYAFDSTTIPLCLATFPWAKFRSKKGAVTMEKTALKTIADNRKARHDYFILESYEAGIELTGTEVKSIRDGGLNLKDSWISIDNGELFIKQMHISPYEKGNIFNKDPLRTRKLLMHKREIMKLLGQVKQDGLTLIPISVYFKGSRVKVQVGLCKGKKQHDKRDAMAQRDAKRTIDRELKMRNR